jgi:hypothetical protein
MQHSAAATTRLADRRQGVGFESCKPTLLEGQAVMKTISVRHLRGAFLRENALGDEALAITHGRVLIGIFIPGGTAWAEHLIQYNWPSVHKSIAEGEQEIADEIPMTTLDEVIARADAAVWRSSNVPGSGSVGQQIAAAATGSSVAQPPGSREVLKRLRAALNPTTLAIEQESRPITSMRTVSIRDLTADFIEQAAEDRQGLALLREQRLIGGLFRRLRRSAGRLQLRWFRGMLPGAGGSRCA